MTAPPKRALTTQRRGGRGAVVHGPTSLVERADEAAAGRVDADRALPQVGRWEIVMMASANYRVYLVHIQQMGVHERYRLLPPFK